MRHLQLQKRFFEQRKYGKEGKESEIKKVEAELQSVRLSLGGVLRRKKGSELGTFEKHGLLQCQILFMRLCKQAGAVNAGYGREWLGRITFLTSDSWRA